MKRYVTHVRVLQELGGDQELLEHLCDLGVVVRRDEGYLPQEVERILVAYTLARELGVNWEGVDVALKLREELVATRQQVVLLIEELRARARARR